MKKFLGSLFVFTLTGVLLYVTSWGAFAQTRPYRVSNRQISNLLATIERDSDAFRSAATNALDRSSWNGTRTEDEIQSYINDFENSTDALKSNFTDRRSVSADVTDVLNRAGNIDRFLQQYRLNTQVSTAWTRVRNDLNTLATYYNVRYDWTQSSNKYPTDRYPTGNTNSAVNRLTGTYRLDISRSSDVQAEIDRATTGLNDNQRDRVGRQASRRLEAPEELAIERNGRSITIASSKSPRVTLDADGRTISEQMPNGKTMNVTATIYGDQLTINYAGDRMNDFYVAFNPVRGNNRNEGDDLRVTRRIYLEGVNRQISVDSYYTKTSPTAQLDTIYRGDNNGNNGGNINDNRYPSNNGNFTVPNGTQLTAVLQTDLDTRNSKEGDRFTMEVNSPSQYNGAIIEGKVGRVQRSGRVSGRAQLELDFETIRMRNGQTYNFEGFVQSARTANGDNVNIDNEGAVREGDNQTNKTVGRTAIGATLGAIIGAIAGGGSGAAIGAGVGAGAGAGSVILQGRDDLNLKSGTELTITASSPRDIANNR
ncbi:MAG: hypothetical protein ABI954_11470 [Pyrinomonadaceae bacterium]